MTEIGYCVTLFSMRETITPDTIMIQKASGDMEPFAPEKLLQSLRAAGADEGMAQEILLDIEKWLVSGVTTKKIYSRALSQLGHKRKTAASRYRIKDALMQLGSSGYPFEIFMGEIFSKQGFNVETGIVVQGQSITHEMDVIATGKGAQYLIECKYSQLQGSHVSIQVPLYVHSRVQDIIELRKKMPEYSNLEFSTWVATNTRFSTDSMQYSAFYGIKLISWDYPFGHGIKDLINETKTFPVTLLSTLHPQDAKRLIAQNIVTFTTLHSHRDALDSLNISEKKQALIIREIESLLK